MTRAIEIFVVAAFAVVSLMSAGNSQQAGSGGGRKHHEQKADPATSTAPKADEKAYNAVLKSLPNKTLRPLVGDALTPPSAVFGSGLQCFQQDIASVDLEAAVGEHDTSRRLF